MDAPPRILLTTTEVVRSSDCEAGIRGRCVAVPFALDLADVRALRQGYDFDRDEAADYVFVECYGGPPITVAAPYADVLAAWLAYRSHTDSISRLRN